MPEQRRAWRSNALSLRKCITGLLILYCITHILLAITPSSYALALQLAGQEVKGLFFGTPRAIRSDEWMVLTPYYQIVVNNDFLSFSLSRESSIISGPSHPGLGPHFQTLSLGILCPPSCERTVPILSFHDTILFIGLGDTVQTVPPPLVHFASTGWDPIFFSHDPDMVDHQPGIIFSCTMVDYFMDPHREPCIACISHCIRRSGMDTGQRVSSISVLHRLCHGGSDSLHQDGQT